MTRKPATGVLQTAARKLKGGMIQKEPLWVSAVRTSPPEDMWFRERPVTRMQRPEFEKLDIDQQLMELAAQATLGPDIPTYQEWQEEEEDLKLRKRKASYNNPGKRSAKASDDKPKPEQIVYPEDALRARFWQDHPFEKFRAHILIEADTIPDRSIPDNVLNLRDFTKNPSGEDAIQFALHLHTKHNYILPKAYTKAVLEFRDLRSTLQISKQYAALEAEALGTKWRKSAIKKGIQNEDQNLAKFSKMDQKKSDTKSNSKWLLGDTRQHPDKGKYFTQVDESLISNRTFNAGLDLFGKSKTLGFGDPKDIFVQNSNSQQEQQEQERPKEASSQIFSFGRG